MSAYSPPLLKILFSKSGNRCAFPQCMSPITEGDTVIGEICHIAAASPRGPRYDANQDEAARNSADNLILLCPTHHTVIDADVESYTVERLEKMKRDHEARVTPVKGEEAANGSLLLLDQSVRTEKQKGGLAAHTVNANTIHFHGNAVTHDRSSNAIEKLWLVILSLKQHFGDILFIDTILTTDELDRFFRHGDGRQVFEPLEFYRRFEVVSEKMLLSEAPNMESERLFVSPRLWSIFFCIQTIYGRTAFLFHRSFGERKFIDWRTDKGIDTHLRAVLPAATVDQVKARKPYGLQNLLNTLEGLYLETAKGHQDIP
jgi:hypothetical protein